MLSDPDLRDWLENLANTNPERRRIIVDLLRHKGEDHMGRDDASDCVKAIKWLDAEEIPERPGPRLVPEALVEAEVEH